MTVDERFDFLDFVFFLGFFFLVVEEEEEEELLLEEEEREEESADEEEEEGVKFVWSMLRGVKTEAESRVQSTGMFGMGGLVDCGSVAK